MKKDLLEKQVDAELQHYFDCVRMQKCPPSMKKSLYEKISLNQRKSWFNPKFALAGLSLLFIGSVTFKVANYNTAPISRPEINLEQAQAELQVAMFYMNQVSLKSLTEVTNKGIKPGLIRPMAISMATL